ncbi:TadE family protein [Agromyces aerolatus]|uniref:TadE family protein n=1 Tax=Agromyces sp. LY-1074 TaxID=3074080 RepID=UPI00285B60E5|nr:MULTISPECIES: TadE family protein [unclassified Agromyces]MDR5699030.1 TadE family protein [Agromyces sp. LY-1074]MDR5705192.1 TadE family protein [Agromyces sp. LY-1358]
MRPSNRWTDRVRDLGDERGAAALEFLTAGIVLLVPLVYVVLALAAVQAGTFAIEGAARHAARVAVLAADDGAARAAVERTARTVLEDAGLDAGAASVELSCEPEDACASAGARIRVQVAALVTLPLVPDLFGLGLGTVRVDGVATQTVSKYAGAGR